MNFYGQTEMAPLATILGPDERWSTPVRLVAPRSTSRPAWSTTRDQPVPPGTVGEIVHRSPHATPGYYRDEDKTAEAFRHGWFHSGDLGYLDEDGRLYVVDRKKDMIKTGARTSPAARSRRPSTPSTASPRSRSSGSATRCGSRRSPRSSYPSPA